MIDALFGSKTRVQLLKLFLNNPGRAFYVREITRDIGEQINSVRRELANLVNIGIIRNDTVDNKLYYEVDVAFKHYEPLKAMFSNEESVASDTKVTVSTWAKRFSVVGNVKVLVFAGKLVHGSNSEVDLLIVGDDMSTIKLKNAIKALEKENGTSLTYVQFSFDDFYYRVSVRDRFISSVINSKHQLIIDTDGMLSESAET